MNCVDLNSDDDSDYFNSDSDLNDLKSDNYLNCARLRSGCGRSFSWTWRPPSGPSKSTSLSQLRSI